MKEDPAISSLNRNDLDSITNFLFFYKNPDQGKWWVSSSSIYCRDRRSPQGYGTHQPRPSPVVMIKYASLLPHHHLLCLEYRFLKLRFIYIYFSLTKFGRLRDVKSLNWILSEKQYNSTKTIFSRLLLLRNLRGTRPPTTAGSVRVWLLILFFICRCEEGGSRASLSPLFLEAFSFSFLSSLFLHLFFLYLFHHP